MDLTPTRSATSGSPAIVCDQGVLRGSVSIYDASSGGNLLCSFGFDMVSSY